jgi:DNA-binding NarL/FixJ family response regulator
MRKTTPIDSLSRREQIVLQWLIAGLRDNDIGPLLGLTTRSVTRVVREICDKLHATTRTQAACIFMSEQKAIIDWDIENPVAARYV